MIQPPQPERPGPARPESVPAEDAAGSAEPRSVLERVLAGPEPPGDGLAEAIVAVWADDVGTLADGREARVAASCLLRPAPGDRVLVWRNAPSADGATWVLSVIERPGEGEAVLASPRPLAIQAPRVGISAGAVNIAATDFVTSVRNRHAVEHTRTETARLRVAQVGTDIRRAEMVQDEINGTFLQRAGTWVSTTLRDARLRARTFLFD